jgi:ribosome biogenesis protein BRX1
MTDMLELLPHSKKDVKVESKNNKTTLNELADLKGCSSCVFFEVRSWLVWLDHLPIAPILTF